MANSHVYVTAAMTRLGQNAPIPDGYLARRA